ncbi:hypothetical protein DWQ65_05085 [Treponema phagedenis]|uniref:Tetratricopeptide repeat protein n=1 Tax=Treponema phagedenis TaxID=162 RepID=A0A0B7GT20_TREPH|nr:hypothetical protein [Treponema phagedenis]QEJ98348.1 hypothetical protein FUT82_10295 [Treponema phagedenis]QEK00825.1 hypothetical protein FUT84_06335 [Treponema phagedenis]QEK03858.1 hypothetical protein FUT83_08605 [Treponema phagedenis]QEK05832.1 hypothetical protein FUT80_03250 [Treponema phagedenis]QEK09473.1 hypothetical protein FUT81_08520 [Treponema phagedenis]
MKKKYSFFIFTVFISASLYPVATRGIEDYDHTDDKEPWHLLEWAKIAYEKEEFGKALLYTGSAADIQKETVQNKYALLEKALRSRQVQKVGDSILDIYAILKKREEIDACTILDEIFLTHSPQFFHNSMEKLLVWLKGTETFPECDYMSGKIYQIEGEYSQALSYYKKAWKNRAFLTVPDTRFDIIYSMADVSGLMKNNNEKEKYLLLVLTEDPVYGTTDFESSTLQAMIRTISTSNTVEKFFRLYRHHNPIAMKAYTELAAIYLQAGNLDRALAVSALAANIAVSSLDSFLHEADFTYRYQDLADLFIRTGSKPAILQWANGNNVWAIFIQFADLLFKKGYDEQVKDIYYKLAEKCPSFEHARLAAYRLSGTL